MVFFIFKRLRSGMVSAIQYRTVQSCSSAARSTPTAKSSSGGNGQKKRPARKESGVFFGREVALADRLDDQGANCEDRHTNGYRRNRCNLLPPASGGAGCVGQRRHDALLDVHRGDPAAEHFALGVDAGPQLDLRFALSFACAHNVYLTVKPVVQQCVTRDSIERNLPVVHLLGGLFLPLNGLAARDFVISVETGVIEHHAYFSSSSCWSASRARCTRIFSAPTVVSSNSAISSYDLPSTCFITNASRSEGASLARANCRSVRSSLRSISSSGVEYVEG